MLFHSSNEPSHSTMDLIRRVLIPLRALSNRLDSQNQRDVLPDDRKRRKFERSTVSILRPADHRHLLDIPVVGNGRDIDRSERGDRRRDWCRLRERLRRRRRLLLGEITKVVPADDPTNRHSADGVCDRSSSNSETTRSSISSRISRTCSIGRSWGSSSPQSQFSPFHVAGHTFDAERPILTTRSTAWSSSGVTSRGVRSLRSMSCSLIALTTNPAGGLPVHSFGFYYGNHSSRGDDTGH
ncbi:hypothetical protein SAMN04488066_10652 [Halorubrum aquaticum]|uniref:Uncharacterized protein n=1 Tax=Halorubrum aquaticum TaxID=387340 RepID=A0A1I3AJL8_9EURY|nr:hypothetical protein SAMN04488066_10652 [Halorubrum aquaticum]